ncbi:MAG: ATP-dependent RecD-like DNA helicase [Deltaproteobacteria bacterium]|nr:MAG: ATP-dependent RecD-like DNA helicase [Deltaproteobacteria bacterium]
MVEQQSNPTLWNEIIRGAVERIVYQHPDSDYTVLQIEVEERVIPVTAVGRFLDPQVGEDLQLHGHWANHPRFGQQFKVRSYERRGPTTLKGIVRYLGSMVDGIGPKLAERMVKYFGLETLRIIDEEPDRLIEVKGIAKGKLGQIREAWERHRSLQEIMVFLRGHDITQSQALRIVRQYGRDAISLLRENPYRLATDIHGIGFRTADSIARSLGIPPDSMERARAAVLFHLSSGGDQGHLYLPLHELLQELTTNLAIPPTKLEDAVHLLDREGELFLDQLEDQTTVVYRSVLAACERGSARVVRAFVERGKIPLPRHFDSWLENYQKQQNITLAPSQKDAITMGLCAPISIITGGPGTGKTTIVRAVCEMALEQDQAILLAAPTGRAAKRMQESTDLPAKTLHRLLEYSPRDGSYQRNFDKPLEADLVIVDEASMIDIYLFYALMRALPWNTRILLVGDADQLPSVGPGQVLRDLIDCGELPVTRLDQIFRQGEESLIVENAHRINHGQIPFLPEPPPDRLIDFYFIPCEEPAKAVSIILQMVTQRIPKRFGFDRNKDIQILSPMHRGDVGVQNLNLQIQRTLQGERTFLKAGGSRFYVGDRVLQTRNDYDKEVFNGDIGWVEEVKPESWKLTVRFEDRYVEYERTEIDDLTLAYAISVHKSQGSEYPAIVMPVMTQHFIMLQRNLLYTGLTRGKKLVCLVGTKRALKLAVENDKVLQRYSRLGWRIREDGDNQESML